MEEKRARMKEKRDPSPKVKVSTKLGVISKLSFSNGLLPYGSFQNHLSKQ